MPSAKHLMLIPLALAAVAQGLGSTGPYDLEFTVIRPDIVVAQRPNAVREPVAGNLTMIFNERDVVRRIELLDLGPGKSGSATVVHLPDDGVVVAGEVVVGPIPYAFASDPKGWLRTLLRIRSLDFETLVPGHGDAVQGKRYLEVVIGLADFIYEEVSRGVEAGLTEEAIVTSIDWTPWMDEFARHRSGASVLLRGLGHGARSVGRYGSVDCQVMLAPPSALEREKCHEGFRCWPTGPASAKGGSGDPLVGSCPSP